MTHPRYTVRPGLVGAIYDPADYHAPPPPAWRERRQREPVSIPYEFAARGVACCMSPPWLWPVIWLGGWNA